MDSNIYGPGDDDYGRNPRLGPSKDNPPIKPFFHNNPKYLPSVDADNNPIPRPPEYIQTIRVEAKEREFSVRTERFIEWVAGHAYRDIRGKYRIYRMNIKTTLNSIDEVWEWWDKNIENK